MPLKELKKSFKTWLKWLVPLLLVLIIQLTSLFPNWIENNYSTNLYPVIAATLRFITSICPFSLGDIFYLAIGISLLLGIGKLVIKILQKQIGWKWLGFSFLKLIRKLLWVYIWFYFLWGLNYYRSGVAYQINLQLNEYSTEELCSITTKLLLKVNECRLALSKDSTLPQPSVKSIYKGAFASYEQAEKDYAFLHYKYPSVKRSLYTGLAPYFGFTGYYNPFSGEAQLRDDVPRILIPFTVCHEMAHQLGYASETEANFVGYLAASQSTDMYFKYSVYLDLYRYARGELSMRNTLPDESVKPDSLVKMDVRNINLFFRKERNNVSPKVMNLYGLYLRANKQDKGLNSYDDVISLLIAYHRQTGKL